MCGIQYAVVWMTRMLGLHTLLLWSSHQVLKFRIHMFGLCAVVAICCTGLYRDLRENMSKPFGMRERRRDNEFGCVRISYAQLVTCANGSKQTMWISSPIVRYRSSEGINNAPARQESAPNNSPQIKMKHKLNELLIAIVVRLPQHFFQNPANGFIRA